MLKKSKFEVQEGVLFYTSKLTTILLNPRRQGAFYYFLVIYHITL